MSHYQPYPAYKDSGVEWLGKVPEHWIVGKVKWEFDAQLGKMLQPEKKHKSDIQVPYHKAVSVQWENIANEPPEIMWASPDEAEKYQLQKDDLLICEGGDVGRAGIFENDDGLPVIIQNSVHRVRPLHENSNKTLLRIMQICRSSGWFDVLCSKATIVHFTSEKLGDLAFPIAPPDEQQAIANHLDRETARIDSLITKKTRFIELLKEKRQALITQAVTKGLDPHVKMKDSGVEWLGEVPEHWEVRPLKFIADVQTGIAKGKDNTGVATIEVPYLRVANVQDGYLDLTDISNIEIPVNLLSKYLLKIGDVLMNEGGDFDKLGRGHIWNGEIESCIHQNHVFAVRPHGVTPNWLNTFASSAAAQFYFMSRSKKSTNLASISSSNLMELSVPLPPKKEQENTLAKLNSLLSRVDVTITQSNRSITLLKERRSALITAAVTGQIDLREAA